MPPPLSVPDQMRLMRRGQRIKFRSKPNTIRVAIHRINLKYKKAGRLYTSRTNGGYMDVWRLK